MGAAGGGAESCGGGAGIEDCVIRRGGGCMAALYASCGAAGGAKLSAYCISPYKAPPTMAQAIRPYPSVSNVRLTAFP